MKIGTLGPSGTNSEKASIYYREKILGAPSCDIVLIDSVPEGMRQLNNGILDYYLVPSVYPNLSEELFRYVKSVEILTSFVFDTAPLVVVKNKNADIEKVEKIVLVEATKTLLEHGDKSLQEKELLLVSSNPIAAKYCAEHENAVAITNTHSIEPYDFDIINRFEPVKMCWIVFHRIFQ